jgi:hypothetical protein
MWGALSDERTSLSFTIAPGPRQRSHSRVLGPRNSWSQFIVPHSRLPKPGGSIPRILILQEQGSPIITPGTGFPFRLLLRLSELRWRYSNSPPRGKGLDYSRETTYIALVGPILFFITLWRGPRRQHSVYPVACVTVAAATCLPSSRPEAGLV